MAQAKEPSKMKGKLKWIRTTEELSKPRLCVYCQKPHKGPYLYCEKCQKKLREETD